MAVCSAAYLVDPCYRAEIEFKAPYAVTSAGSEYFVQARSSCNHARASSWSFFQDIRQGETVRTQSSGLFNCTSDEFKVQYVNDSLPTPARGPHHESVIVGTATLRAPAGGSQSGWPAASQPRRPAGAARIGSATSQPEGTPAPRQRTRQPVVITSGSARDRSS